MGVRERFTAERNDVIGGCGAHRKVDTQLALTLTTLSEVGSYNLLLRASFNRTAHLPAEGCVY